MRGISLGSKMREDIIPKISKFKYLELIIQNDREIMLYTGYK